MTGHQEYLTRGNTCARSSICYAPTDLHKVGTNPELNPELESHAIAAGMMTVFAGTWPCAGSFQCLCNTWNLLARARPGHVRNEICVEQVFLFQCVSALHTTAKAKARFPTARSQCEVALENCEGSQGSIKTKP